MTFEDDAKELDGVLDLKIDSLHKTLLATFFIRRTNQYSFCSCFGIFENQNPKALFKAEKEDKLNVAYAD